MVTGICDVRTRYAPGAVPCGATMCGECEGMGCEPWGDPCGECKGTGRRPGMTPLRAAVVKTVTALTEPFRFGWALEGTGGTVGAFRLTWRDHAFNRGALWRYARSLATGTR